MRVLNEVTVSKLRYFVSDVHAWCRKSPPRARTRVQRRTKTPTCRVEARARVASSSAVAAAWTFLAVVVFIAASDGKYLAPSSGSLHCAFTQDFL